MRLIEQNKSSLELHGQLTCAVCDRPVDRIEYVKDPYLRNGVNFRAYCHGDTETIFLPEELFRESSISFGKAFMPEFSQLENKHD
jgi:hypothetical protein